MLFDQFKYDNNTEKRVPLQCRFVDATGTNVIDTPRNMTRLSKTLQKCVAPKTDYAGQATIEVSANGQQWQDVGQNVTFYNGPRVTSVNPTYGVVKNPKGLNI